MTGTDLLGLVPLMLLTATAVTLLMAGPFTGPRPVLYGALLGLVAAAFASLALPQEPRALTALLQLDRLALIGWSVLALAGAAAVALLPDSRWGFEEPLLIVAAVLGAAVMAAASHGVTLFLGLEIVTFAQIGLFAFERGRADALWAGYLYLILGALASALLLLGLGLLYAATGSLAVADWAGLGDDRMAQTGFLLQVAGLAFKLALIPFHGWIGDVFAKVPPLAAAVAGAIGKGGAAILVARWIAAADSDPALVTGLTGLAMLSMVGGNLLAVRENDARRMLGYSSIAQGGFLVALAVAPVDFAAAGLLYYIAAYSVALLLAFSCLNPSAGELRIEALTGLARRAPMRGLGLALALLSLAGLPISAGFVGKLYLFGALANGGRWGLLVAAGLGSVLGLLYYFRYLVALFSDPATDQVCPAAPARVGLTRFLLTLLVVLLAFQPILFL